MNLQNINIENVAEDARFRCVESAVADEIKFHGDNLSPIILFKDSNSNFIIIDGFKRFSQLKVDSFQAIIFDDSEITLHELLFWRIQQLFFDQKLNFLSLGKFISLIEDKNTLALIDEFLSQHNLDNVPKIKKYFQYFEKNKETLDSFTDIYSLDNKGLGELMNFKSEELAEFSYYFCGFNLSGNKLTSLLSLLRELKVGFKMDLKNIFKNSPFDSISDIPISNTKYNRIKNELFKLRYPNLSELKSDWSNLIKQLNLPSKVTLQNPEYFEENYLTLKVNFSSTNELRTYVDILQEKVKSEKNWERLLDLI